MQTKQSFGLLLTCFLLTAAVGGASSDNASSDDFEGFVALATKDSVDSGALLLLTHRSDVDAVCDATVTTDTPEIPGHTIAVGEIKLEKSSVYQNGTPIDGGSFASVPLAGLPVSPIYHLVGSVTCGSGDIATSTMTVPGVPLVPHLVSLPISNGANCYATTTPPFPGGGVHGPVGNAGAQTNPATGDVEADAAINGQAGAYLYGAGVHTTGGTINNVAFHADLAGSASANAGSNGGGGTQGGSGAFGGVFLGVWEADQNGAGLYVAGAWVISASADYDPPGSSVWDSDSNSGDFHVTTNMQQGFDYYPDVWAWADASGDAQTAFAASEAEANVHETRVCT